MRIISGIIFILIASLPYVSMFWRGKTPLPPPEPAAAQETLTIISPHRREVRLEYSRGFHEWMFTLHGRNVRINWLDTGGTSKILKELESRFTTTPGAPGVDLLFGGGTSPYYTAIKNGWLTRTDPPADSLAAIPATCAGTAVYDTDHRWFGVALSGFGILYNKPLIQRLNLPVPETWEDLGRPEFLSWLSSADPRASGTVHMSYEIILQAYGFEKGWSLLTRICANVRNFNEGSSIATRDIATGDVAAGMVIDQYAQTVIDSVGRDALAFVLPRGVTIIGPDAVACLRGAPAPALAALFVDYALSEEGQRLLYQPPGTHGQRFAINRLPVRKHLYDAAGAPQTRPYDFQGGFVYDELKGMRRWKLVNDLIGTWLLDTHEDLVKAWKEVIRTGMNPERVDQLCTPPVTGAQLETLTGKLNDPRQERETIKQWANEAKQRYRNIAEGRHE